MSVQVKKSGFTLVELLIVIAIIGILASTVLVSLNSARTRAKTTKALTGLKSVNTALEGYYALYGSYPVSSGWQGYCSAWGADLGYNWIPELATTLSNGTLPIDPRSEDAGSCHNNGQQFIYRSNGINYKLISHAPISMNVPQGFVDPRRPTWAWGWWSSGASGW